MQICAVNIKGVIKEKIQLPMLSSSSKVHFFWVTCSWGGGRSFSEHSLAKESQLPKAAGLCCLNSGSALKGCVLMRLWFTSYRKEGDKSVGVQSLPKAPSLATVAAQ